MKNKHFIVILCLCGLSASAIGLCINSVGVFYTPVSESLNILRGTFAVSAMLQLLAGAFSCLFIPKLLNKYHFKSIIFVGVLGASLSTFFMGLSNNIYYFYILCIIRGFTSTLYSIMVLTTIINKWFKKYNGLMTSLVLSFSGIAGAISAPLFTSLISTYSWQVSYMIKAGLIFILTLPALLYKFSLDPKEESLSAYGMEEEVISVESSSHYNFYNLYFILFLFIALTHTLIVGFPQHFIGFSQSLNYSANVGAKMLSFAMVGNIVGKLIYGYLCDLIKPIKASLVMMGFNFMAALILIFIPSELTLYIGALFFGFIYAVSGVGWPLLTSYFFGVENYIYTYPIVSFFGAIGSAIALPMIGYVYDFTASYLYALILVVVLNIVNGTLILIINKKMKYN